MNKEAEAALKMTVKVDTTTKALKIDKGHVQIEDAAVDLTGEVNNFR